MPFPLYSGNPPKTQTDLVNEVNTELRNKTLQLSPQIYNNIRPDAIQNGMCFILSLKWIVLNLNTRPINMNTPEFSYDLLINDLGGLMTVAEKSTLYKRESGFTHALPLDTQTLVQKYLRDLSNNRYDIRSVANINLDIPNANYSNLNQQQITLLRERASVLDIYASAPPTTAFLIINHRISTPASHAMAMIHSGTNAYKLYDPNHGVYTCNKITDLVLLGSFDYHIYVYEIN